ncbi:hypothetical protein DMENIID0001_123610 [Sergentomyia squamirostris]
MEEDKTENAKPPEISVTETPTQLKSTSRRRRQSSPVTGDAKMRRTSSGAGKGDSAGAEDAPDATFELDVDMMVHDFDDERTLEEEEEMAKAESEDPNAELSTLQMESEMPLEELLKMYNCQYSQSGSEATSEAGSEEDEEEPDEEEAPSSLRKLYPEIQEEGTGVEVAKDCDEDEESLADDEAAQKDFLLGHCQIVMVGAKWQATIPEGLTPYDNDDPSVNDKLLWDPNPMDNQTIEGFLKRASEAEVKQRQRLVDGDENGAHLATLPRGAHLRDSEGALYSLMQAKYNLDEALVNLESDVSGASRPWSEEDCRLFEEGIRAHGKVFRSIHEDFLPHRRVAELIEFYYLWKKTERHDSFANVDRLQKKKYKLNPGVPDFREDSPGSTSLIQFDSKRLQPRRLATVNVGGTSDHLEPTEMKKEDEEPHQNVN